MLASLPDEVRKRVEGRPRAEKVRMDRSEPPFVLTYWGYTPDFDTTDMPKTRAALDAAGIPHDRKRSFELPCEELL